MYAAWIPEVLDEVAALADAPDPPLSSTIAAARGHVANRGRDSPRPVVSAHPFDGQFGVALEAGRETVVFLPGDILVITGP